MTSYCAPQTLGFVSPKKKNLYPVPKKVTRLGVPTRARQTPFASHDGRKAAHARPSIYRQAFRGPSANCIDRPLRSVLPPVLCPALSSCPALPCAGRRLPTCPVPGAIFLPCPVRHGGQRVVRCRGYNGSGGGQRSNGPFNRRSTLSALFMCG